MKYYAQKQDGWCLYACAHMLLEFNGIKDFNQKRLHKIHAGGSKKDIATFISEVNQLLGNRIEYNRNLNLRDDDIKNHINNENPVCVNLYLKLGDPMGHSHIIYGYDDNKQIFYIIDPQPKNVTGKGKYYEMSYNDFSRGFDGNRQPHVGKEIFIVSKLVQ